MHSNGEKQPLSEMVKHMKPEDHWSPNATPTHTEHVIWGGGVKDEASDDVEDVDRLDFYLRKLQVGLADLASWIPTSVTLSQPPR